VTEGRYLDTAVAKDRTYCYRVRAVSSTPAVDVEGPSSAEVCAATVDRTPPPAPAGTVLIPGERSILISWGPVAADDLLGYLVYRAADEEPFERLTPRRSRHHLPGPENPPAPYYRSPRSTTRRRPTRAFSDTVSGSSPSRRRPRNLVSPSPPAHRR
jgi:hypothetical protein